MSKNELVTKTVRRLIGQINHSNEYIARKLHVSVKSLNRWYSGECTPSALSLICLYRLAEGHPLDFDSEDVFLFIKTGLSLSFFKVFPSSDLFAIIKLQS